MYIKSIDNKKIKTYLSLLTKKGRQNEKRFLLESIRAIEEGIKVGVYPEVVLLREDVEYEGLDNVPRFILEKSIFNRLATTENSRGIIGVYSFLEYKFKDILKGKILFLDGIQDPGNLGAIIRSSVALGLDGLILGPGCVDLYNDKVLRSTLGGIFSLPIVKGEYKDLGLFKKNGFILVGTDLKGKSVREYSFPSNVVVAVGNENKGLSNEVKDILDEVITIPMKEGMESLNASIAASIVIFQMVD